MAADEPKPRVSAGAGEAATPEPVTDEEPTSPRAAAGGLGAGGAGGADDRERDRGLSDFVRRAVSAGVGAATRSKDDIMRVAAGEMRNWLEQLNLNEELAKALSKLVIEVRTEVRFRPNEEGKMVSETVNDVKIKPGKS